MLVELVQEQLAVSHDDHEEIVEVVRDAAGQPADGLHLLRLAELLLALTKRLLRALAFDPLFKFP